MCVPLLCLGPLLLLLQSCIVNGQEGITPDGALTPSITNVEIWQPATANSVNKLTGSLNGGTRLSVVGEGLRKLDGSYDESTQVYVASVPAKVLQYLSDANTLVVETLPLPEAMQQKNQVMRGPVMVCASAAVFNIKQTVLCILCSRKGSFK